jgi:mRNA interferase RelE/StbE
MGYKVIYGRAAEKYLDNQTPKARKRIMDAVDGLPAGDVRKLNGREGYRLVVGGYRILFDYVDNTTVDVVIIGPRWDVYKR